jgi:N-acetylglucosamine-6-phosphate deacetylase
MICSGIDAATGEAIAVEFAETIRSVRSDETAPRDVFLAPGFVDLQVNGFAGVDFNNAESRVEDAIDAMLATGVTRCLPTVITGPPDKILASLRNLRRAQKTLPRGHVIAGFHVEGPHIDAADGPRGAHPVEWVRPPDLAEFQRWQEATDGNIRLVTLSPHWPGAPQYIAALVQAGVAVSLGHTGASAAEIAAAVDAGATLSTHLGNAAPKLLPKIQNCLWEQLAEDRLSASFIADGLHLGAAFFRVALRAKGVERTVLVTDAAAPAGASPGPYRLGELEVELTADGRLRAAHASRRRQCHAHRQDGPRRRRPGRHGESRAAHSSARPYSGTERGRSRRCRCIPHDGNHRNRIRLPRRHPHRIMRNHGQSRRRGCAARRIDEEARPVRGDVILIVKHPVVCCVRIE